MPSKPHAPYAPVFSLLLAATLWGVIWYPLRLLEQHGLHGLWTSLVSYGAALVAGWLYIVWRGLDWRRERLSLLLMGLAAGWCNVAFILAVIDGTVVRVLLLFYLSPVWAVLLGRWVLGERPSRAALAVVGLALLGALVMLWDDRLGMPWPKVRADWLALSAGVTFAMSNVLVRRMRAVSIALKTMASWVGVVLVAGLWVALGAHAAPAVGTDVLLGAVALGLFGIVLMTAAVQYGVTHMPVHRSAVILLFELVAGASSSWWLAHEAIALREWVGGMLIIVAAYIAGRRGANDER